MAVVVVVVARILVEAVEEAHTDDGEKMSEWCMAFPHLLNVIDLDNDVDSLLLVILAALRVVVLWIPSAYGEVLE